MHGARLFTLSKPSLFLELLAVRPSVYVSADRRPLE